MEATEVCEITIFVEILACGSVGFTVGACCLLATVQALLYLLVQMEDRESQIVPEFWVSTEGTGRFFEIVKGLLVLFLFEQGQTEVEKYLGCALGVQRAYVLMR